MKKTIIVSTLTLLFNYLNAQNYVSLLDSNIFWNGKKSDFCAPYFKFVNFFINGDTLINSNYYYKVYKKDSIILGSPTIDTLEYSAALREDTINKKVFLIPVNDSVEKLIYDFSLTVNDTVNIFNISGNWTKIVESIDYIEIDSTCRKRLKVYSDFCEEEYWIEGIGSTKGLLFAGVCGGTCVDYDLNSVIINKNDTIYNNLDTIVSCSIQQPTIDSLTIIPTNPTTNDTIKVISYTTYPNSPCYLISSIISIVDSNSNITVYASHYASINVWPMVCNSIDTLTIGKLIAATFELNYHLLSDTAPQTTYDIDTIIFVVQQTSGIKITDYSEHRIKVYPNPFKTTTTIFIDDELLTSPLEIKMYDIFGREIRRINKIKNNEIDITRDNLTGGLYFIKIISGNKILDSRKIIIE